MTSHVNIPICKVKQVASEGPSSSKDEFLQHLGNQIIISEFGNTLCPLGGSNSLRLHPLLFEQMPY